MAVELDHSFTTDKPLDESFAAITDLERVVPAVEGGSVLERTGAGLGQGADPAQDGRDVDEDGRHDRGRRAGRRRPSRGDAGQGARGRRDRVTRTPTSPSSSPTAAARSTRRAQITGKAASMGEGVMVGVLDGLITDFTTKLGQI